MYDPRVVVVCPRFMLYGLFQENMVSFGVTRMTTTIDKPQPAALLNEREAAEILGVRTGTLSVWRSTRRYALPFCKIGRCVRYRASDIEAFVQSRTVTSDTFDE